MDKRPEHQRKSLPNNVLRLCPGPNPDASPPRLLAPSYTR